MDQQPERPRDDGFSLMEVVVAVVLMAGVLTSAAGLMIRSTQNNRDLQGKQAAVAVARQVMENVRAVSATFSDAVPATPSTAAVASASRLVAGRSRGDVVAQWAAAAAAGIDVSQTYTGSGATAFDSHAYTPGLAVSDPDPAVAPVQQTSVNNQTYTVDTLIGTCVRQRTGDTCGRSASGEELFRVVVHVTWSPSGGRQCGTGACSYQLTTLVDPTIQPTFNVLRKPVCVPDPSPGDPAITTLAGQQREIVVLGNDSGYFPLSNAVELSVAPASGSVVTNTDATDFFYTPNAGFSGLDTFTYACIDVNNMRSDTAAKVTIKVLPVGVTDVVLARTAVAQTVSPLVNDRGSSLVLTSVGSPSPGGPSVSVGGSTVTLQSNVPGTFTVPYTGKDADNQTYTGSITFKVTTPPIKAVDDSATAVRGRSTAITVTSNDTVSDLTRLTVGSVTNGTTSAAVLSPTSGQITYTPSAPGSQTIGYTITDVRNQTATARAIITVYGAVADGASASAGASVSLNLLANDVLPAGASVTSYVSRSSTATGTMTGSILSNGKGTVSFSQAGTYLLDYTVTFTASGASTTDVGTLTVVVS